MSTNAVTTAVGDAAYSDVFGGKGKRWVYCLYLLLVWCLLSALWVWPCGDGWVLDGWKGELPSGPWKPK